MTEPRDTSDATAGEEHGTGRGALGFAGILLVLLVLVLLGSRG